MHNIDNSIAHACACGTYFYDIKFIRLKENSYNLQKFCTLKITRCTVISLCGYYWLITQVKLLSSESQSLSLLIKLLKLTDNSDDFEILMILRGFSRFCSFVIAFKTAKFPFRPMDYNTMVKKIQSIGIGPKILCK